MRQNSRSLTSIHHGKPVTGLAMLAVAALLEFSAPAEAAPIGFAVTNLVTDDQSANAALLTDPALKNAWGIASTATSPFWVGDNGTGVSTLYAVNPATGVTTKNALTVTIPGDGSVTGVANNSAGAPNFNGDNFLGLQGIEWVILGVHSGGSMQERTLRRRYSSSLRP